MSRATADAASPLRIAFYAPLKAPDHPVPSGDRTMARLLMTALRAAGHRIDLVPGPRSFAAEPDPARLSQIEAEAKRTAEALAAQWRGGDRPRPDLWFTYHPFYKAPDFLGPKLARAFGLPYVTAEASHAAKRASGPWAGWHKAQESALRAGALHICFTARDREGLAHVVAAARLLLLAPFIATPPAPDEALRGRSGIVELVTLAMMRPGDKSQSYAFLAEALLRLPQDLSWRLTIIGDGPAREAVRAMFADLPAERLVWRGEVPAEAVAETLAGADLYVWPGFGEAYGLAYLEAAAAGLPALALDCGGIASVVEHERTGLLVRAGALEDYVGMLKLLILDEPWRRSLGAAARRMIEEERSVTRAAAILNAGLMQAMAHPREPHA